MDRIHPFLLGEQGLFMSISFEEALVEKLYNDVNTVASYVCGTLRTKASMAELREQNDPTFGEIRDICRSLKTKLSEYDDTKLQRAEELITVIDEIIYAISEDDNAMIVDCICHLDQFVEMHLQNEDR